MHMHVDIHISYAGRNGLPRFVQRAGIKQESLELGFKYWQSGEALQSGRQWIPGRWSNKTEDHFAPRDLLPVLEDEGSIFIRSSQFPSLKYTLYFKKKFSILIYTITEG